MAATSTSIQRVRISDISPARKISTGVVEVLVALFIFAVFARTVSAGSITTFVMTPGGITTGQMGNWVIPSQLTLYLLAALSLVIGLFQLIRGFGKITNLMVGLVFLFFIFSFLTWQAADKSLNLAGMLSSAVQLAVPITMGSFSGILCERSGVVNIAIEGMMLMSAMVGALMGSLTHSAWLGLFFGVLSAVLLAALHAVLSIKYKIDQIISGTVINMFSAGMTAFLSQKFLQTRQELNNPAMFTRIEIPGLAEIPLIGPILFNTNFFVYLMFALLIILQVALFSTRWGLRVRSVGEHPKAADTLGINVIRTRYMSVLLGGMVAGMAGAFFTLGSVGRFEEGMTAGKGFIGLAAMIFGNYTPIGALGAGILFGFADSLGSKLSLLGSAIPSTLMSTAPYVITMIVLAGFVGKGHVPAADGVPYTKE
ncbi:MAG TPA: ABC transporter permease [Anaerolineaceae bacterium]|jgi:simple sugar transport system permease protein|nr:ABC transporter permease [Chloroflexota bacterium]HNS07946.1 ABC transporter permease [Anaerolineaceae bacterium]HNW14022.1 ABC transporter permease [Anaerolineaceae bacterium]HOE01913.1 ABC transporter permease [Anaerolineaceae bacterium]HOQ68467.1 ABC transporter permease [Anaerolineaceae bacterium]